MNIHIEQKKTTKKQYDEFLEKGIGKVKNEEYAADIFNACLGDSKSFITIKRFGFLV